jgi:hypothetical protein
VVADDKGEVEVEEVDEVEVSKLKVDDVDDAGKVEDIDGVDEDGISTWSTDPGSLPPASDASVELIDASDDEGLRGWPTLKRKASKELMKVQWKVARKEEIGAQLGDESEEETDDDGKRRSRSAIASRRLKESAKSTGFVVDERKRVRFQEKCVEIDRGAKFRYEDASWQVLHSKCLKWLRMTEPYNTTRFKAHSGTCRVKGEGCNTSITNFFKLRDPNDVNAEAKPKITVPGRKQIFEPSMTINPRLPDNRLVSRVQPCLGISDAQDPRVSTYINRTVVEGAGSISIHRATEEVYGDGVKYSELSNYQKGAVAIAQSHRRLWSINREHQVVFSTSCAKFIPPNQRPQKKICASCETVARSDAFKRALRVKPPPLETMKYIPIKFRTAMADLGAKFANVKGLSDLLHEVCFNMSANPSPITIDTYLDVGTVCSRRCERRIQRQARLPGDDTSNGRGP